MQELGHKKIGRERKQHCHQRINYGLGEKEGEWSLQQYFCVVGNGINCCIWYRYIFEEVKLRTIWWISLWYSSGQNVKLNSKLNFRCLHSPSYICDVGQIKVSKTGAWHLTYFTRYLEQKSIFCKSASWWCAKGQLKEVDDSTSVKLFKLEKLGRRTFPEKKELQFSEYSPPLFLLTYLTL